MSYATQETRVLSPEFLAQVKWAMSLNAAEKLVEPGRTDQQFCQNIINEPTNVSYINRFAHLIITMHPEFATSADDQSVYEQVDARWDTISGNVSV